MTSSSTLEFSKQGLVAVIKLNRPDVYNSINRELALALQQCLDECAADTSVRAVLITGAGKAFCAGQDLVEVTSGAVQLSEIVDKHYNPIILRLRQPGKARGGGSKRGGCRCRGKHSAGLRCCGSGTVCHFYTGIQQDRSYTR